MPDISELVNLGPYVGDEGRYIENSPFAAAGDLQLWNVMVKSNYSADQANAIALVDLRRGRGVLVDQKDIPALYDLLRGIVERNKLT